MRALLLLFALPLLLVGCAVASSGDFTSSEGPEDTGEQLGPGGYFGVWYWEMPSSDESAPWEAVSGFNASFVETLVASVAGEGGVEWASPGSEECVATVWDAADLEVVGGVPGEYEEMDAGTITFASPSWSVELEAWDHVGPSQYYFELNPDYAVHFEEYYEVSAVGDDMPTFSSTAELLIPAAIHLVWPPNNGLFEVPEDDDLVITWDGGSLDEIWIEFHPNEQFQYDNVQINCLATNDGEFAIPQDLIELLPTGESLVLALQQPYTDTFMVGDIELSVGSGASTQCNGERP